MTSDSELHQNLAKANWRAAVKPGSRFEEAIQRTGHYISPKLVEELSDAILAIKTFRAQGPDLHVMRTFKQNTAATIDYYGAGIGYNVVCDVGISQSDEVAKEIAARLQQVVKMKRLSGVKINATTLAVKLELDGNNIHELCEVLCDGYINPTLASLGLPLVDYKALLAEKPLSALQNEPPAQMQTPQQQQQARHQAAWSERTAGGVSGAAGGRAAS